MDDVKFKEAIAGVMKDRKQREALAELIVEYIQPNHLTTDYVSRLLTTRSLKPGDSLVKKIRKGISVHTWVPGSISLKHEVTVSERINYVLDAAIVSVMANEWELESGEIGTIESLRAECSAKLADSHINRVFTALSSIWNGSNTPNNYATSATSVSQTVLEDMINVINQNTSGAKAIVGVRSVLTPITKFGAYWQTAASTNVVGSQSKIDEVLNTGWLGNYMGVPLVAINQIYNNPEDHTALLPTDKLLVVGDAVGEFITYGGEKSKEWTDNEPTPPYWHLDIVQQFGMIIDNAEGIGVIEIT
jgi:hypothetical protein